MGWQKFRKIHRKHRTPFPIVILIKAWPPVLEGLLRPVSQKFDELLFPAFPFQMGTFAVRIQEKAYQNLHIALIFPPP